MSKHDDDIAGSQPASSDTPAIPQQPGRRRFGQHGCPQCRHALAACATEGQGPVPYPSGNPAESAALDRALRENVKTIVVIYAENRSFNNLFADFPGLEKPLSSLKPSDYQQRDRDGSLLKELPPAWNGVLIQDQSVEGVNYAGGKQYQTNLPNAPFALKGPQGEALPLGLVTRDLWHVFYQNQMQINGGKNDGFVAWADSGGLTMGHYARPVTTCACGCGARVRAVRQLLPGRLRRLLPEPPVPDLRHRPLLSERDELGLAHADRQDQKQRSALAGTGTCRRQPGQRPAGPPKFGPSALTPDGYAVNTMAPPYWPTWSRDRNNPAYAEPNQPSVLVPQTHEHIGDKLNKKGIDWAWYAGAWQATLDEFKDSKGIPKIPTSSTTTSRSTTSRTWARKTPPSATSACAMAAWATSRAPTASSPTSKPASCRR
jgi:hypothetical protein